MKPHAPDFQTTIVAHMHDTDSLCLYSTGHRDTSLQREHYLEGYNEFLLISYYNSHVICDAVDVDFLRKHQIMYTPSPAAKSHCKHHSRVFVCMEKAKASNKHAQTK